MNTLPPIHRGRCTQIAPRSHDEDSVEITLRGAAGTHSFNVRRKENLRLGDIVEVIQNEVRILTPNRSTGSGDHWTKRTLDPRRQKGLATRLKVEGAIRDFFNQDGFLETRTPLLVPCPGMEPHIRPFGVNRPADANSPAGYLPTSPEFAMKRLLVGGLEKIFQICPAFRDEPPSVTHHPEFTILEWYRAYACYEEIMRDTEELFAYIANKIHGRPVIVYQGQEISVQTPWLRLRVRDLFLDMLGIDLVKCSDAASLAAHCSRLGLTSAGEKVTDLTWDDLYFKIWLNCIEPNLPSDRAVFVTRYPASQAALSVIDADPDGSRWAKRFEVYAGGLELGNAFEELTDPSEQRRRFEKDMELRTEIYGESFPKNPLDEDFLNALTEGMPPSGGIAMGVDRMVMLFADEPEIDYTVWL